MIAPQGESAFGRARASARGGGVWYYPAPLPPVGRAPRAHQEKGYPLASRTELSDFLAGVERRAFKQAVFAVRDVRELRRK